MKLKITIDNRVYEVDVEASEPEVSHSGSVNLSSLAPPPPPAAPVAANANVGQSPVAGVVVKLPVSAGQSVEQGQTVMVLEAMKMETAVTAPRAGVIKTILVAVGEAVQGGQPLYEFEAPA